MLLVTSASPGLPGKLSVRGGNDVADLDLGHSHGRGSAKPGSWKGKEVCVGVALGRSFEVFLVS